MVGCVIVHGNKIIGEGWTQAYGGAHAEVNAISTIEDQSMLPESTAYVTLEPCAHFGKTPPCADLLVKHKFKRVVVACTDPNPMVAGKGIAKLKASEITVELGLLEQEAIDFNKRFFTSLNKKRPYVILKWAKTSDGFIARKNYDSKWISNEYSRKLGHQWRAEEDAIMVGTNTAKYDDPMLNVRDWKGKDPVRVVIDKQLRLDKKLKLFNGTQSTLCYNLIENAEKGNTTYIKLKEEDFLEGLLLDLYKRKVQSMIVEGGSQLLQSFIDKNLWDEARIFTGEILFEEGIAAPKIEEEMMSKQNIMKDSLTIIRNTESK
jgi:diaminohydroxyphosphoribosylaminopyrimidine deaminase/5-amino-6-(5-phosphoribosylamino)uracil reductase